MSEGIDFNALVNEFAVGQLAAAKAPKPSSCECDGELICKSCGKELTPICKPCDGTGCALCDFKGRVNSFGCCSCPTPDAAAANAEYRATTHVGGCNCECGKCLAGDARGENGRSGTTWKITGTS